MLGVRLQIRIDSRLRGNDGWFWCKSPLRTSSPRRRGSIVGVWVTFRSLKTRERLYEDISTSPRKIGANFPNHFNVRNFFCEIFPPCPRSGVSWAHDSSAQRLFSWDPAPAPGAAGWAVGSRGSRRGVGVGECSPCPRFQPRERWVSGDRAAIVGRGPACGLACAPGALRPSLSDRASRPR